LVGDSYAQFSVFSGTTAPVPPLNFCSDVIITLNVTSGCVVDRFSASALATLSHGNVTTPVILVVDWVSAEQQGCQFYSDVISQLPEILVNLPQTTIGFVMGSDEDIQVGTFAEPLGDTSALLLPGLSGRVHFGSVTVYTEYWLTLGSVQSACLYYGETPQSTTTTSWASCPLCSHARGLKCFSFHVVEVGPWELYYQSGQFIARQVIFGIWFGVLSIIGIYNIVTDSIKKARFRIAIFVGVTWYVLCKRQTLNFCFCCCCCFPTLMTSVP